MIGAGSTPPRQEAHRELPSPTPPQPPAAGCARLVGVGIGVTAMASRRSEPGPTPEPKPLAQADPRRASSAPSSQGVTRQHPAHRPTARRRRPGEPSGGGGGGGGGGGSSITSSPLFTGGSGRLWVSKDGRFRLELQDQKGDTQVIYDGHNAERLRRRHQHALPLHTARRRTRRIRLLGIRRRPARGGGADHEVPSVAQDRRSDRASCSSTPPCPAPSRPTSPASPPTPCASRRRKPAACSAAPSCRSTPTTAPRCAAAIYSTDQLLAGDRTGGHAKSPTARSPDSVFAIAPPPNAKVEEVKPRKPRRRRQARRTALRASSPKVDHPRPRRRGTIVRARRAAPRRARAAERCPKACPR